MRPIFRPPDVQTEKVCELFMLDSLEWNVQMVRESFCLLDAEETLN